MRIVIGWLLINNYLNGFMWSEAALVAMGIAKRYTIHMKSTFGGEIGCSVCFTIFKGFFLYKQNWTRRQNIRHEILSFGI